jgi:hypothetical protein
MKKAFYAAYISLFILTLSLLCIVQINIQLYGAKLMMDEYYIYCVISSFLFCFLGFLSVRQWFLYFLSGKKSINLKLLIFGAVLFAYGAIPVQLWYLLLGIRSNMVLNFIQSTYVNHAVNMLAGIMIGKSFK